MFTQLQHLYVLHIMLHVTHVFMSYDITSQQTLTVYPLFRNAWVYGTLPGPRVPSGPSATAPSHATPLSSLPRLPHSLILFATGWSTISAPCVSGDFEVSWASPLLRGEVIEVAWYCASISREAATSRRSDVVLPSKWSPQRFNFISFKINHHTSGTPSIRRVIKELDTVRCSQCKHNCEKHKALFRRCNLS